MGFKGKAKAALNCWIVVAEYKELPDYTHELIEVKSVKVDGENILANTYYRLTNGELEQVI
ncbi:hypothetical protein HDC90_001147 [Pedobacter sp. AK013]|nr:hypothetical protein [Pedobacter sp. AK013]